jgi:hypothetical protein
VRLIAGVLGVILVVLVPLAHGSPIDPSTPGFWDNGDFDDVILFLTSNLHLVEVDDQPPAGDSHEVAGGVPDYLPALSTQHVYAPGPARAPPTR